MYADMYNYESTYSNSTESWHMLGDSNMWLLEAVYYSYVLNV